MTTQTVPIQAFGMAVAVRSSASASKGSAVKDFELLFGGSVSREKQIGADQKSTQTTGGAPKTEQANETGIPDSIIRGIKTGIESSAESTGQSNVQSGPSIGLFSAKPDEKPVDEATAADELKTDSIDAAVLAERIMAMLNQIRSAILEMLNLTPEKLDTMMKDMGIEPADLADPKAIMRLMLAASGSADAFAVLTNEQLGNTFKNLVSAVNEIMGRTGIRISADEIRRILKEYEAARDSEMPAAKAGNDDKPQQTPDALGRADEKTDDGKDKGTAYREISAEKVGAGGQKTVAASKSGQELKDTGDGGEKSDRTEGPGPDSLSSFLDKLDANYDKPVIEIEEGNVRVYDIREIARQIIDRIKVVISREQMSMELWLHPEQLGRVNLTVSSKDGAMTAQFTVQNDLAKEAIEGQLVTLKETLIQQGIKVESIEVTIAGYTFNQDGHSDDDRQQEGGSQRSVHRITLEEAMAMSEEPDDEDNIIPTGTTGLTIDYTA